MLSGFGSQFITFVSKVSGDINRIKIVYNIYLLTSVEEIKFRRSLFCIWISYEIMS